MTVLPPASQLVTVFGGSGFLGRHIVRALTRRGYRVRAAMRRPDLAGYLQPLGTVGQVHAVQANLRYPDSVAAAVRGADAVINLVGIMQEKGRQNFASVQAQGARGVAEACARLGVDRLVQVSALGADAQSPSLYARSKAAGEASVLEQVRSAVILRPSVMFGPDDTFFNRFATLTRILPVLPLAGAETRFQPVFAGDVAEAAALAIDGRATPGTIYELGGPQTRTLRELVDYVCEVTGRKRLIAPMPAGIARLQGQILELLDLVTLGLLPRDFVLTRDQVALLGTDNVVSAAAEQEGRTLRGLGIAPVAAEAEVPGYLWRFRKSGQFDTARAGG